MAELGHTPAGAASAHQQHDNGLIADLEHLLKLWKSAVNRLSARSPLQSTVRVMQAALDGSKGWVDPLNNAQAHAVSALVHAVPAADAAPATPMAVEWLAADPTPTAPNTEPPTAEQPIPAPAALTLPSIPPPSAMLPPAAPSAAQSSDGEPPTAVPAALPITPATGEAAATDPAAAEGQEKKRKRACRPAHLFGAKGQKKSQTLVRDEDPPEFRACLEGKTDGQLPKDWNEKLKPRNPQTVSNADASLGCKSKAEDRAFEGPNRIGTTVGAKTLRHAWLISEGLAVNRTQLAKLEKEHKEKHKEKLECQHGAAPAPAPASTYPIEEVD